jgi:hypothetical protein
MTTMETINWIEKRAEFQNRFDKLSQTPVDPLLMGLNKSIGTFVARGGLSETTTDNPQYQQIQTQTDQVERLKAGYATLHADITTFLTSAAKENDLKGKLAENGELQNEIQRMETLQKEMKVDVESAVARDDLLRTRNTNVTRHQLFLLDRPIRRGAIPYLWALSVLFIGIGLILFHTYAPTIFAQNALANAGAVSAPFLLYEFITSKAVLIPLLVSAMIVILFLSLKVARVL